MTVSVVLTIVLHHMSGVSSRACHLMPKARVIRDTGIELPKGFGMALIHAEHGSVS